MRLALLQPYGTVKCHPQKIAFFFFCLPSLFFVPFPITINVATIRTRSNAVEWVVYHLDLHATVLLVQRLFLTSAEIHVLCTVPR